MCNPCQPEDPQINAEFDTFCENHGLYNVDAFNRNHTTRTCFIKCLRSQVITDQTDINQFIQLDLAYQYFLMGFTMISQLGSGNRTFRFPPAFADKFLIVSLGKIWNLKNIRKLMSKLMIGAGIVFTPFNKHSEKNTLIIINDVEYYMLPIVDRIEDTNAYQFTITNSATRNKGIKSLFKRWS